MLLNARRVYGEGDQADLILLAIEDITDRRRDASRSGGVRTALSAAL